MNAAPQTDTPDAPRRLEPVRLWLWAARPKTLPAGAAPVLIGAAMAYADGGFHAPAALCALAGALLLQIGANYANDYFDHVKGADNAGRLGPLRVTQAGLVSPRAMVTATALTFALACLPGAYLAWRGGWPIIAIGLISMACAVLYTGGPLPLGYLGLGDLFVLPFFGPVAVGGTYYVQTGAVTPEVLFAGLGPGLLSVAILDVNNLRDIEQDRAAGKRTLPVRFGRGFGRAEYVVCLAAATLGTPLALFLHTGGHPFSLAAMAALPAALPTIAAVLRSTDGPRLNDALAGTGRILLLYSVLFSIGWAL